MSQSPATRPGSRARPLSPHLTVYKPTITMTMSIVHRVTGAAMYFGTLLVAWWVIAASISESYFDFVNAIFGSWIGRLGVRHLVWDTGAGLEKHTASKIAWATLAGSLALTLAIWIAGYMARGA
jgi:succinate dehydrogenase / fumarate reductase cytochrome b subunit